MQRLPYSPHAVTNKGSVIATLLFYLVAFTLHNSYKSKININSIYSNVRKQYCQKAHNVLILDMIQYDWNNEKNEILKEQRNVSFEQVVLHIEKGDILDILQHPNKEKYPSQKMIILRMNDYIYVVPFVEKDNVRFLKTIIPNRKLNKKYQEDDNG